MLPDFTLLIALLLGLYTWGEDGSDPLRTLLGTTACVAVGIACVFLMARRAVAAAAEGEEDTALATARATGLWALMAWAGALQFFGWQSAVEAWVPRIWWMARFVVLFTPAAILFAGAWAARARVEGVVRSARGGVGPPSRAGYAVVQHLKRNALALVPLFAILGVIEGIYVVGELGVPGVRRASQWIEAMPLLSLGLTMALMVGLSLALPAIVRRLVRADPLPEGRVRTMLERTAKAISLRYGHLVVWRSGGRVLNAMVVGLTPRTRTIFLTDGLLERLPDEEILAVFAHEAGHAKLHHLVLYLVIFFSLATVFQAIDEPLAEWGVHPMILTFGQIAILWFGLLGWTSRKFEREADVYGAEHAAAAVGGPPSVRFETPAQSPAGLGDSPTSPGDPPTGLRDSPTMLPGGATALPYGASLMIRALDRIGRLSGHVGSLRHGTLQDRMRFVAAHATNGEVRGAWRRTRRNVRIAIVGLAGLAIAVAALQAPGDVRYAKARVDFEDAVRAHGEGESARDRESPERTAERFTAALEGFRRAAGFLPEGGSWRQQSLALQARMNAADTRLHGLGDRAGARQELEALVERVLRSDLPPALLRAVRFQAEVDLGRIAAGEGRLEDADRHMAAAVAARPQSDNARASYERARLALLEWVIGARRGDPAARAELERLASKPRYETAEWKELQRDARDDLALLPS